MGGERCRTHHRATPTSPGACRSVLSRQREKVARSAGRGWWITTHGGMGWMGKNGGTVSVPASRQHARRSGVEDRRQKAVRPRAPALPQGKADWRAVASGNAAVLACNGRSRQFHTAQHLQAWHGCKSVWLCCGKPRLGRSTQGADIRLPGLMDAWSTRRGRCTWFRQCR